MGHSRTRVGVFGAGGRMGATVCQAVLEATDAELVAAVDPFAVGRTVPGTAVVIAGDGQAMVDAGVSVVVDFTVHQAALANLRFCADRGIHTIVGTTGFSDDEIAELRARFEASTANAAIVANFAIGAVLMMRFAELAAPWFETAEIIELHHDQKKDAPSGTAMKTAERMAAASAEWGVDPTEKTVVDGARGGVGPAGIRMHSVRLRGLVAHQEVILGTAGETLTIRHDSIDRVSFMPGVLLAVRGIANRPGLTIGLEPFLGLS